MMKTLGYIKRMFALTLTTGAVALSIGLVAPPKVSASVDRPITNNGPVCDGNESHGKG